MHANDPVDAGALTQALALAGVGCWILERDSCRGHATAALATLFGQAERELPEDIPGWLTRTHPEDRAALSRMFGDATPAGKNSPLAIRLRHGDGLWHWFELRATTLAENGNRRLLTFVDITGHKQSEAALRDNQLRYRALYTASPLAFIFWDRQGHISEWNNRAEALFGWKTSEVIGKRIHRLLLPEDIHTRFGESVQALIHGQGNGEFSGPAIGKDGLRLECNWYSVALRAPNGSLLGILSLVLDVTADRLAHARLEKSEKVYRTLFETSPDAILLLDMKGRFLMANQHAHRLFGIDELDDLGAIQLRRLMPPEQHAEFLDDPAAFTGFIITRELTMFRRDGSQFDAATAFTTIADSRGQPSGIVLFVRDITEKRRLDRELDAHRRNLESLVQARTLDLEHTRDTLAQIIDGSPVPTFVIDSNHRITHWNDACTSIVGIPAEEIIGTTEHWRGFYDSPRPVMADLVISEQAETLELLYGSKFRRSEVVAGAYEAEDYFPSIGRWLFFTACPLRGKDGRVLGAIETLQDITTRKQAEMALSSAKRAAEAAASAKAEFLANMSHEIRTPMNAVIGLAHLLLKTELGDRQRDFVSRIQGAGQILLGLINDILDFSKIEAGQMQLEHSEFRLDDVLDKVTTVVLNRAQEKGLELHYVVEPDVPPHLIGDFLRLAQLLINLIGNAIKFTTHGSVTVFFRRQLTADERIRLEVDVQDTGIGMTLEQQGKLFQAFSQADSSITRKFGGTGLGLTICKRLTGLMQGDIWVTSQPGVGSTFSFTVTLGRGNSVVPATGTRFNNALVVDDNPLARNVLARLLEKHGCKASMAESGEQALAAIASAKTPFDCITIDLNMPGMNGLELADAIRSRAPGSPRLVMVTAADTSLLDTDPRFGGLHAVLHKPVTAAQIGQLLADHNATGPALAGEAPLHGLQVLLVEDVPTNRLIATEMLESFGARVSTAENGRVALERIASGHVDIVLMDIQMPEMDGLEATRRLRADPRWQTLPIIAMTAHAFEEERQRCLAAGMNDFITKPIDPPLLQRTLVSWRPAKTALLAETPSTTATPICATTTSGESDFPALPGIDTVDGLRRMMNKPRLYEKVLRDFHSRFVDEVAAIQAAINAGEIDTAMRRAHSAKGLAGSIGAARLQSAALALEMALRGETRYEKALLDEFASALSIVTDSIGKGFGLTPPAA